MRKLLFIFLVLSIAASAQDKLIFKNGKVQKGIVVSISKDKVLFRNTDTSGIQTIKKTDLLLLENRRGIRYLFAAAVPTTQTKTRVQEKKAKHSIGVQPFGLLTGRATLAYEHFIADGNIGIVIPLSITFDPIGVFYNSQIDTSANAPKRISGVNFISGLDVNFYVGNNETAKFFIGPRFRYGTDVLLRNIEAYSLQTQVGWCIGDTQSAFIQHISVGFGFARIVEAPGSGIINTKNSYGWYSVNYRLGIRW